MSSRHAITTSTPAAEAIPALFEQHAPRLYALGRRLCGSEHEAEDLVQETFLQAYRRWETFDGRADPGTWLWTIAARMCQRLHRKRAGEPAKLAAYDELLPFRDVKLASTDAVDEAQRAEARAEVERAIAQLPVEFRLPLVLKEIIGFPVDDVARMLNLKPATVKTRLHRARLKLRQAVDEALPKQPGEAPPPAYEKQVCLDLLAAKQAALDRGVAFDESIICDRCRTIFAELDLAQSVCRDLAAGELPDEVRARVLARISDETPG